eukprot:SAG31_NODE_19917_length_588_cov_1.139059_1_plen_27_part_10
MLGLLGRGPTSMSMLAMPIANAALAGC